MTWNPWNLFSMKAGASFVGPPERKIVLLLSLSSDRTLPPAIVVGYMKYAAGDHACPYFVTPGHLPGILLGWRDCLPEEFGWPHW